MHIQIPGALRPCGRSTPWSSCSASTWATRTTRRGSGRHAYDYICMYIYIYVYMSLSLSIIYIYIYIIHVS